MKRFAFIATAAFALTAGALAALPRMVSAFDVKGQIERSVGGLLGTPVTLEGEGHFAFAPWPAIVFDNPRLAARQPAAEASTPPLVAAGRLVVTADLSALVTGGSIGRRILIEDATIVVPDLALGGLARLDRDALARVEPGRLAIANSRIRLPLPGHAGAETVSVASLEFGWPDKSSHMRLDGNLVWRDTPVTIASRVVGPVALAAGRDGTARVNITVGGADARFDGRLFLLEGVQVQGDLRLRAPDPAALARLLRLDWQPGFAPFELSGEVHSQAGGATLADAELTLGRNAFDGAFSLRFDGKRPSLQGTLASALVDLSGSRTAGAARSLALPDMGGAEAAPASMPAVIADLRRRAFDPALLGAVDVDLRLSAKSARLGPVNLTDAASNLILRDGRLRLEIGEAMLAQGRLTATLDLRPVGDGTLAMKSRLALADARLEGLGILPLPSFIHAARTRLTLEADSDGRSVEEVAGRLRGRGQVVLTELKTAPLPGLAEALKQPLNGHGGATRSLQTGFASAEFNVSINGHTIGVENFTATSPTMNLRLVGSTQWPNGPLALRGAVQLNERAGGWAGDPITLEVPISLAGSLGNPVASTGGAPLVLPVAPRPVAAPLTP